MERAPGLYLAHLYHHRAEASVAVSALSKLVSRRHLGPHLPLPSPVFWAGLLA